MSLVHLHDDEPEPRSTVPARRGPDAVLALADDYWRLAQRVAATEFVPKALRNRPEAVVAALLSGAERGLGPMESLRSINVIEGKPGLSAEAMRALVLAAGHDIDFTESTATRCTITGRRRGSDHTTTFTWTIDRARRANLLGKDNWRHYPEDMLRARATTELCKAIFPDVTAGLAVIEVLEDEAATQATAVRRQPPARRQVSAPPIAPAVETSKGEASAPTAEAPVEVLDTVGDQAARGTVAHSVPGEAGSTLAGGDIPGADQPTWAAPTAPAQPHEPALAKRIHAEVTKAFPDETAATRDRWRHALVAAVTRRRPNGPATSSTDLDLEEQLALSKILTNVMAGQASVADGPDDTIELRVGGGWRYTISLDGPTVTAARGDTTDTIDTTEADDHLPLEGDQ